MRVLKRVRLAIIAASLLASPAYAQAINWSGAGWYAGQETFINVALYAGPFPNEPACLAAIAQLQSQGYQNVTCAFQGHNPDDDARTITGQ